MKVRALITAEVNKGGYREFPVARAEAYAVDTALDTDADSFSLDLGSPRPDLSFLLERDNEVRATLFTTGTRGQILHLHTGIADMVGYDSQDHVISIAGRDLSCVATDSQAPPGDFRSVRPQRFVTEEARKLGITKMKLASVTTTPKFYRDGQESYWESWYRLYRNKKMWMWLEPDGTLMADKLHYAVSPSYRFGTPTRSSQRQGWMPVTRCQITKDNQKRVGQIWVFGERGDIGFVAKAIDPSIREWKRRPHRIITSSTATNRAEALDEAWEEIFEGKVGALELTIELPLTQTGRMVRQNSVAELNIPDMGIHSLFFVVGTALRGGPSGHIQVVRLREKNYAISRRVPADPAVEPDPSEGAIPGDIGALLDSSGVRWANAFAAAAMEFHGGWPYDLFLGVLISICHKESSFQNKPENSDVEWFAKPTEGYVPGVTDFPSNRSESTTSVDAWRRLFANEPGSPGNMFSRERGVGPMQLTTKGYKVWADEFGHKSDEYEGGRWMPEANIRAGARAFAGKLAGLDPKQPNLIWEGVRAYNGSGSAAIGYRDTVRAIYRQNYEGIVTDIEKSANTVKSGETTNVSVTDENGGTFEVRVPTNAPDPVKKFVNYLIRQLGKPYGWSQEGPNSFDCSGLVWAAAKAAGHPLANRSTYTLFADKSLAKVTKDRLLPGDLVYFAKGDDIHHMGVYLNDGHMIHAPHTGDVVKISALNQPYYRDQYHGANRIFTWPTGDNWWADR